MTESFYRIFKGMRNYRQPWRMAYQRARMRLLFG